MATENMIKQSLSQFTVDSYDKIIAKQGDSLSNVFVSPLSIYTAIVMTMAGADGKTRTEIESALRIPKQLLATCPHGPIGTTLQTFFKPSEGVQLSLANRLFVVQPATIVEQFKQILTKDYDASIEQICSLPSDEAKRQHINKWTSENTGQKITELLPTGAVNADTVLALVNELYFKGMWKNQFDKRKTLHEDFTCFGGKKMDIMMMHVKAHFPYEELTDWSAQAVRLPFKGTDWQMLIILPWDASGLPSVLSHLRKPGNLEELLKRPFHETELDLFLPKFKLSQCEPVNAKALLKQCGINTIFDAGAADLKKLCSSTNLFLSDVFHKAILEVDEEGATAAAATAVMMNMRCAMMRPTVRVDRPFFVALICASTVPVFIGHVTHPGSN
uniref:Serine protease inhibitor n=1 Tax=Paragonimus westermani TaxID=34504 RepID=A9XX87_9TREM|nr:serine protease inhibitor [Paragonimus westermani]